MRGGAVRQSTAGTIGHAKPHQPTFVSVNDTTAKGLVTSGTTATASTIDIIARYQPPGTPAERTGSLAMRVPVSTLQTIDVSGPTPLPVGAMEQFQAVGNYTYNLGSFYEDITSHAAWSTSNASLAMASAGGLVNALAEGTVDVRAAFGGRNGSVTLTIVSE